MRSAKIAITVDEALLESVDLWVQQGLYPNRSQAIQAALREKDVRWRKTRLEAALAKADMVEEKKFAEEWFQGEVWPDY